MAIDYRAAEASRQGEPLSPDGVQVAGKGSVIIDILKALGVMPSGVVSKTTREGSPPYLGETPPEGYVPPQTTSPLTDRIPVSAEERRLQSGEYEARQKHQAPLILSPEGQRRFEKAGYSATDAITPPQTVQAIQALGDAELMAGTVSDAQRNLLYADPKDMSVRPGTTDAGAADEVDALGAANAVDPERVQGFVNTGEGGLDFNFNNLETGDDVKSMINEVSEIYANPTTAAKRGVVTQQETLDEAEQLLANELGFTRKLLKRKRGVPFNAAEATASRLILARSAERLTEMAKAIKDGERSPAFLIAFRRQMSIHAGVQMQVKGMQTEIARAMNAFNIPVSARTAEDIADAADAMLLETGGTYEAVKLAKGILDIQARKGDAAVHKFVFGSYLSKANGVFSEFYINGLLSWLYTHLKNVLATPSFMAYQLAEEVIAGVYGTVERGVGRGLAISAPPRTQGYSRARFAATADGVYAGQAVARLFGMSRSFKEAWITASETFRTEVAADALSKIEGAQLRAIDAENLNISGKPGQFIDALGRAIRIPGRALMAADDFWRVFAQRGELSAEAYRQAMMAKSLGKSDEYAFDNFAMSMLDPRSYANQLDEAARYNALTSDTGTIGELTAIAQNVPVLGRLFLPFTKVPVNNVLRVMERFSPTTGIFKDPVKRQKAMARVTLAYGAVYTLSEYAADGRVTGSMPRDQRQRDMLPPGWRPYSLVFKGEGWPEDDPPIFDPRTGAPNGPLTYVSYAGLEPVGAILGIVASTSERMRRTNDPEAALSYATAAMAASADYFTDMPMIKVIGDIVKAVEQGDMSGIMSGPLRGFMPYSAAVRAGERAVDPTIRKPSGQPEYYTIDDVENKKLVPYRDLGDGKTEPRYELVGQIKGGLGATFTDAMQKWESMLTDRVLFGGADEDTSAIKYDVFGEVREANVRFDVNPVHAMYNMIIPFNVRHGKRLTDVQWEQIRLKSPLRDSKRKEKGFGFSEAFRSEWTKAAKKVVRIVVDGEAKKFMPALKGLIASADYALMTDQEQFDAIQDLEDRFYDAGLEMVFDMKKFASVRDAYRDYQTVQEKFKREGRLRR